MLDLPSESLYFFAKIDLKDGFQSVVIHPYLRRFFGTQFYDEDENAMIYANWITLPQGHRFSSGMFRMAVQFVINLVESDLRIRPLLANQTLGINNLQDDFLIAAKTAEICQLAVSVLLEYLDQYGFKVNPKKMIGPVEEITYCGWKIQEGTATPLPSRTKITPAFVESAMENLVKAKPGKKLLKEFRYLASLFQYYKGFISGEQYQRIRVFHEFTKKYQKEPNLKLSEEDTKACRAALEDIVNYILNGLPPLRIGNHLWKDTVATIIITDANIDSWSAILFRLVKLDHPAGEDDFVRWKSFSELIDAVRSLPGFILPDNFTLLPYRIEGGVWTARLDKSRTSTIRERLAQYYAIHELLPLLKGPVIMVSDNSNSRWDVAEPQIVFQGAAMTKRLLFQQEVHHQIWLPRDSLPSIADTAARILAEAELSTSEDSAELSRVETETENAPELLRDFLQGYEEDLESQIGPVRVFDIWRHLSNPEVDATPAVREKATQFKIGRQGLLTKIKGEHPQIVVPKFISRRFPIPGCSGPISLRSGLLFMTHAPHKVHLGEHRNLERLSRTWWWPQIAQDVKAFVSSCSICVQAKAREHTVGKLSSIMAKADRPHQAWMMDHAGPFRLRDGTTRHILLFIDLKSRELRYQICEGLDAATVGRALLEKIIFQVGIPERIHSDNGRAFTSQLTHYLATQLHTDLQFGIAYHPRGQGAVERAIGEIKISIQTSLLDKYQGYISFPDAVAASVAIYNQSAHTDTGISPYEYLYGTKARTLDQTLFSPDTRIDESTGSLDELRRLARQKHDAAHYQALLRQKQRYDSKAKSSPFAVGSTVYRKITASNGTLNRITGPHRIIERAGTNSWYISPEPGCTGRICDRILASEIQLHIFRPAPHLRRNLPNGLSA